jgi:hypothetical protein
MTEKGGDSNRLRMVGLGLLLGFAWGTIMWAITGAEGGWKVWLYISLTMAMIGAGVAGIFGAMGARKRGERISPRIAPKDAAERKAEAKAAKAEAKAEAKAASDARKQSGPPA